LEDGSEYTAEGHSARRLNALASLIPATHRYLEIGVKGGGTFERVRVAERIAVDPFPAFDLRELPAGVCVHATTSDRFFAELPSDELFDLIFVDGLHQWLQTYRDLINSFRHLKKGGVILLDDVVPSDHIAAMPSQAASYKVRRKIGSDIRSWQGDVYKTLFAIHDFHPEVDYRVIVEGGDNCQAIMWLKHGQEVSSIDAETLQRHYGSLTYLDCFPNGSMPDFFRPLNETAALHLASGTS